MADTEAGLLPGERLLWTGRPARARVIPGDLVYPGLLLVALLAALALSVPRGPAVAPGGLGDQVLAGAAALAGLIATTVRALRVKPDELRRTVYRVTDRRVLITTGTGHSWAAYLDQLAEPVVMSQRDGTADLTLRATEKFSLGTLANSQPLPRAYTPGSQPPFPVLRGLPDAELARQVISAGRERMMRGALDVPPVDAQPGSAEGTGFVPAPGEQVLWVGRPQAVPWWFGAADIAFSAYLALFVVAIGFVFTWARSTGAPLVPITVFTAAAALAFGYPAIGRVLRRHARIRRSAYIITDSRLVTTWRSGGRMAGTQCGLAQLLPPEVRDGSVFLNLAWPPPARRRYSQAQLLWPAASTDPPQLIGPSGPQAVADLICSAQLAERARTWAARQHTHLG
ncbi:MAG TPA: hypothetical protein VKU77_04120 [Streptosporangiaceae bacterium]|nr:hypothetical protein [Streptosporangiaceae bacterium]